MNAYRSTYKPRLVLHIGDMTGKRCASAVVKAVAAVDARAKVQCNLTTRKVIVESNAADVFDISRAISSAGFTPRLTTNPATARLAWQRARDFEASAKPGPAPAPVPGRARARHRADALETES
jgi:copper chaperone CopZ